MANMHLPIKYGTDVFIQLGVIDIFPKLKMAAAAILDLLEKAMYGTTREGVFVVHKNFVMIG